MEIWPVILTGTIIPHPDAIGKLNDPLERERQYIRTLKWMAKATIGLNHLIFCENSDADLSAIEDLKRLYSMNGRVLEAWQIPMPANTRFRGKGWGEGLIIKWALLNIKSVSECNAFIKLTGRYRVLNLKRIVKVIRKALKANPDLKFICQSFANKDRPVIETQFFWCNRQFYIEHMLELYEDVDDIKGNYIEHAVANRLTQLEDSAQIGVMPLPMIIRGVMGWNAKPVMSVRQRLKEELKQIIFPLPSVKQLQKPGV